ncbi:MAG: trigger factor [Anaerolineaceae bacterium]|nr:trigger factor [Anaerolineaceae bacterium]
MKVETQARDDQQVKLIVEIEPALIEQFRQRAARSLAKQTKIPGFRPGKAPYDVIRRYIGNEYIDNQALEMLVNDIYPKAIAEAKIEPSGSGMEEKISLDPPAFEFIVPLMPDVNLGDYRALRMKYKQPKTTEEDVDQYIHNLQTSYATAEPKEGKAAKGDLVYIRLSGTILDPDEGMEADFLKEQPTQMIVGDTNPQNNDWPFEGFNDKLAGLEENGEKTIDYTYPDDTKFDRLKGKKVSFNVVVQSVKKLDLPALDDEFAKNFGDFESYAALREKITEEIQTGKDQEYDNEFKQDLIDKIVEKSTIKFPPHYLEEETEHVLNQIAQDLSQQRMDLDSYIKSLQMTKEEFIDKEVKPSAEKRLNQSLVLDKIALLEKVNLDGEELNMRVASTMAQIRNMPEFKKKKNEARLAEISRNVTMNAATQILQQNVFDLLKRIAAGENIDAEAEETSAEGEEKKATKKKSTKKEVDGDAKPASKKKTTPKKEAAKKADTDGEAETSPKKKVSKKAASSTADTPEKKPAKKPAKKTTKKDDSADTGSKE